MIPKKLIGMARSKSPWLIHLDCSSCNGCDIEVLACLTPLYDVERFGILNVGNPKHADILVVTGTVNHRNQRVLKNIYDQMPEPKVVVAVGACGSTGGVFRDAYNVVGGGGQGYPGRFLRAGLRAQAGGDHRRHRAGAGKTRRKREAGGPGDFRASGRHARSHNRKVAGKGRNAR